MDLARLFHPRSVAVVGASERPESYGGETLLNLRRLRFPGDVWGVNPGRAFAHRVRCFPALEDLPGVPDAVVVAIPAAGVPDVIAQARSLGCGGAVVYAEGGGPGVQAAIAAAARGGPIAASGDPAEVAASGVLPVVGPNCDGVVALHSRAALWGDALARPEPGPVALISQSGNLAVNALATRRGLRLHTVISSGNEAVVSAADYLSFLAGEDGLGSVAMLLERDGDGAALCEALARCAEAGIGVAVLKVGASERGAAAAAAHTGALAGDQRVFRALVEEAGAVWADDVHDLLELAKAMAGRGRKPRRDGGLAILTCSGGDSGLGADEAVRRGIDLAPLAPATSSALRELLPEVATVANPLDYTGLIWGETGTLRELIRTTGEDPAVGQVLVFYDRLPGIEGAQAEGWDAVQRGILEGARACPVGVVVASTLPELLDDAVAAGSCADGVPAVAGLRTGIAAAAALAAPPGDPGRLREIAAQRTGVGGEWLAEHEAKERLRAAGIPVVHGRVVAGEDDAVAALAELGGPVAIKRSAPGLLHKRGALTLGVADRDAARAAFRRLAAGNGASPPGTASVLVERMAAPGAELLVSVRRDGVVPGLVVGLGGVYAEVLDDVAIVPLPVTPERAERAIRALRGAPLLAGADVPAAAALAAQLTRLELDLIECNPVIVHPRGAVVVDAVAKESAP